MIGSGGSLMKDSHAFSQVCAAMTFALMMQVPAVCPLEVKFALAARDRGELRGHVDVRARFAGEVRFAERLARAGVGDDRLR